MQNYIPKLYFMVGISASGKSSIAKEIAEKENCIIVSSDDIRGEICDGGVIDQSKNNEVFQIFHKRIKEGLISGKNVIADATNVTIKARKGIFNAIKNTQCYKIAYIVPKPVEKCIEDNIYKEYPVPHYIIQKQMMNFQVPFMEEGFDEIILHKFDMDCIFDINYIINEMSNFDQHNPHHSETLLEHCELTADYFMNHYDYSSEYNTAATLHDIGKLFTQKFDDEGVAHYYQHENVGSYFLLSNYNNMYIEQEQLIEICFLINYHMMPMNWWNNDKLHEKWRKIFGDYKYKLLLDFNACDKIRKI